MESTSDWRMLENENYHKIYSKLKFKKEKSKGRESSTISVIKDFGNNSMQSETSPSSINSSFSSNEGFDFLPYEIISTQPHIMTILNKILSKDKLFFNWTAMNKEDSLINGVYIYECKLKSPSINKTFLKTVFKNSIKVESSIKEISGDIYLITLDLNLNKKNIEEISEVASYELFVQDEENEYTWMGLSRFKILNSVVSNEDSNLRLRFNFMTNKRGNRFIEVNKFNILINPKNHIEKSFTISNITNAIVIEL